ncbi:FAD-dependent monooxygenase [Kiloniella laminariae]|uniref:FAD-dependent monooxygenase n=1 Tax=Kiloniella laminariae TaxID=454162 RepID=UPI00036AE5DE|nr:FAD-dependent monooxygenase [Kiloniella laminariae]
MRVLVVGGGIAGLCCVLALRQKGISADVIEKASGWRAEGAGLHLPGNAIRPMEQLGILSEVAQKSFAFPTIRYCDDQGDKLFSLDLSSSDWPHFQALRRADFHQILVDRIGNASVRFGTEIKNLSYSASPSSETAGRKCAHVIFSDGQQSEYDLVIAADGINSSLRRLLWGDAAQPVYAGFCCWRWTSNLPLKLAEPSFMLGRGKVFLVMPIAKDQSYVFAAMAGSLDLIADVTAAPDILRREFAEFGGAVPKLLENLDQDGPVLPGTLAQMLVSPWSKESVVLVGDAAHGTLPTLAQGATMAMEDALVLAESLKSSKNLDEGLKAYEARRLPRAQWVQQQSLKRMGLARLKARPLVFLRNKLMGRLGAKILASGWRPLIDQGF